MNRFHPLSISLPIVASLVGCSVSSETDAPKPQRVPVSGVVRLDGKPLADAVVVFLPSDEQGLIAQSDTDESGAYALSYAGFPGGTTPGSYRVGISYHQTPTGRVIGLAGRGALPPDPEAVTAQERVPQRYSDLGRTELSAVVPPEGGMFDFDLEGPLLPAPAPAPSEPETSPPSASSEREPAGQSPSDQSPNPEVPER